VAKYRQIRKTAKEEVKLSHDLGSAIIILTDQTAAVQSYIINRYKCSSRLTYKSLCLNISLVGYEKECGYLIKYNNDKNVVITFSGNDAYLEPSSATFDVKLFGIRKSFEITKKQRVYTG